MRDRYFLKSLLNIFFTIAFLVGNYNIGFSQTPLPIIDIFPQSPASLNVSAGAPKVTMYEFTISVSAADAILTSVTIPTEGVYSTSDIAVNGFKLWYSDNGKKDLLASSSVGTFGTTIIFSGLNKTLEKDKDHHLTLTVDLASSAKGGNTFKVKPIAANNFTFSQSQSVNLFAISIGTTLTIRDPKVLINASPVSAANLSPGSVNNIIYQLKINSIKSGASINQIVFTTGGTYLPSDIASGGFKLYLGDNGEVDFDPSEDYISVNPVATGESLVFDLSGILIKEDNNVVYYLTADISTAAEAGRNLFVKPIHATDVVIANGSVLGQGVAGGKQTFVEPSVTFSNASVASNISAGTMVQLFSTQVSVADAPVSFSNATFQFKGTYSPSDFTTSSRVVLVYHKTTDPLKEWDDWNGSIFILGEISELPSSGGSLTFNSDPSNSDLKYTIPEGEGYISILANVNENSTTGHSIQITASGLNSFKFISGTLSGTIASEIVQTIVAPIIDVSGVNIPASNISPGAEVVVYAMQANVSNGNASLKNAKFTTSGSYSSSDLYGFYLYSSDDATYDDDDKLLGYSPGTSSGNVINFDFPIPKEIKQGTSYLLLVAVVFPSAPFGNTINITPTPVSNLKFVSGAATGITIPAGGIQTFAKPGSIELTFPAYPNAKILQGSNDNLIYRFTITPKGSSVVLNSLTLPITGSFASEDLLENDGFRLYMNNTNSFEGSELLTNYYYTVYSGDNLDFNGLRLNIEDGTTKYFFLTANISDDAVATHTIHIGAIDATSFSFGTGTATGTGAAGGIFEIYEPTAVLTYTNVTGSSLLAGSKDNIIYKFNVSTNGTAMKPTAISFTTVGTFNSSDIEEFGFKLYYNNSNTFTGSHEVSNYFTANSGDDIIFYILEDLTIDAFSTGYFFVTADISSVATAGNTLQVLAMDPLAITFNAGTATGTSSDGGLFVVSPSTGVKNKNESEGSIIYPNPAKPNSTVIIASNNANMKLVSIYNSMGTLVKTLDIANQDLVLQNLDTGIYLIKIQNLQTNQLETQRLVIE